MEFEDDYEEELEGDFNELFDNEEEAVEDEAEALEVADENSKPNKKKKQLIESVRFSNNQKSVPSRKSHPRLRFSEVELCGKKGLEALKSAFEDFQPDDASGPYSNMNQLLDRMSNWAHSLFPTLNFDDFLEKVEPLGKKRLTRVTINQLRMGVASMNADSDDNDAPTSPTHHNLLELEEPTAAVPSQPPPDSSDSEGEFLMFLQKQREMPCTQESGVEKLVKRKGGAKKSRRKISPQNSSIESKKRRRRTIIDDDDENDE